MFMELIGRFAGSLPRDPAGRINTYIVGVRWKVHFEGMFFSLLNILIYHDVILHFVGSDGFVALLP